MKTAKGYAKIIKGIEQDVQSFQNKNDCRKFIDAIANELSQAERNFLALLILSFN